MISKDTAAHYTWGGDCDGWELLPRPDLHILHERMPAGRAEVAHRHSAARQFFFVLSGRLTMEMDDGTHRVDAGQGLEIPPQARHQARNDSDGPLEFLVVSHPTTRGDRIDG
jgi:mannose-6-phosphate isomerase-like protein (cupin superfamily)